MQENKFDGVCSKFSEKWQKFISVLTDKLLAVQKDLDTKNTVNITIIAILCVAIFAGMYAANKNTPFAADDYAYHYIYTMEEDPDYKSSNGFFQTGERVQSISDIILSMKAHYYTMNGRLVLHFLVQLMLLLGKQYFNVINSAMYVALLLLIYKHSIGRKPKTHNAVLFAAIALAVWTFCPDWGITNVWLDGSINYLWGSVIRLTALLPFRLCADGAEQKKPLLYLLPTLVMCTAAGATNENTGAAFIGMCALYLIYYKVKKIKIHIWQVTGLAGALAGFGFMCLSPGNFLRITTMGTTTNQSFIQRLIHIPGNYIRYIGVFAAIFLMLALLLYLVGKEKKEYKIGIGFIYLLGSIGGAVVMLASPTMPKRAWQGLAMCALVAAGNLFAQMKLTPRSLRLCLTIGTVIWLACSSISYIHMIQDAKYVMIRYEQREEYIEEQKSLGNYDIKLIRINPQDPHSPLYGVADLGETPDEWQNVTKAKYYGLHSITTEFVK